MTLDGMQLAVAPGEGLVARFGGVVLIASEDGGENPAVDRALRACRELGGSPGPVGEHLADRLGPLLGGEAGRSPALCALAWGAEGLHAVLQGDLELQVARGRNFSRHAGAEAGAWLDLVVDGPFDRLTVGPTGVRPQADPRIDLGDGVIPGGGVVLFSRNGSAFADETDETDEQDQASGPPEVPGAAPPAAPGPPPLPAAAGAAPQITGAVVPATPPSRPTDEVLRCRDGHANALGSRFCSTCGLPLLDPPAPAAVAVLVLDDGTSFPLDATYVVGRDPAESGSVQSGQARALVVDDPDQLVSRVHAEIRTEEGRVVVVDRDSANGTFVSAPGDTSWTRIEPGVPVLVQPGGHVLVGRRTVRVDGPPPSLDLR
jgi:hypothetical protein